MSMRRLTCWVVLGCSLWATRDSAAEAGQEPAPENKTIRTDLYGDPLPADALARLGTARLSAANGDSLAFSPDGKLLAVGDYAGTIRLFDPDSGKELHRFSGHGKSVFAIAFSPDGNLLASAGDDGTLRVWNWRDGKEIRQADLGIDQLHRYWPLRPLTFSADGKVLSLSLFSPAARHVRFWDVATAKAIAAPAVQVPGALMEALSPDGRTMVGWAADKRIVWDQASGTLRGRVPVAGDCDAMTLSADGRLLALVAKDAKLIRGASPVIQLWDVASGKELGRLEGHRNFVSALVFSPDGKVLASGGGDEKVRLWETASGRERWHYQGRGGGRPGVQALAFSPDSKALAAIGWDGSVRLLDRASGKERGAERPHPGAIFSLDFTPDGKGLVTAGYDLSLRLWETATGKQLVCLREPVFWNYDPAQGFTSPPGQIFSVACASDGKTVALAELAGLSLWDLAHPAKPRKLDTSIAYGVAFSPDAKILASCNIWLHLWDVRSGKKLREIREHGSSGAYALSFSPDGQLVATGGGDHTIRLWDVGTGAQVGKMDAGTLLRCVSFSPDGRTLASRGDDNLVRLWEVATRRERARIPRRHVLDQQRIPFSPDGRYIALTWAGTTSFHNAVTGEEVHQYKPPDGKALVRLFSPEGRTLALQTSDLLMMDASRLLPAARPAVGVLAVKELAALWSRLADRDAEDAARAIDTLAANPEQAVPFLRGVLPPARPAARSIADLIRDLDDKNFGVREKATSELAKLGRDAETLLRRALQNPASEEARRRLERLVAQLDDHVLPADTLRAVRAVEALERTGSPEARSLLRALGEGAPEARLSQEARATLARLAKRATNP